MAGIERIKIEDAIISNGDFLPLESILRVGRVQNAIFFNGNRVSCENTFTRVCENAGTTNGQLAIASNCNRTGVGELTTINIEE